MRDDPRLDALIRQVEEQEQNDPHDSLVRQVLRLRAGDACEYCLLPTTSQFHVDHVIPEALWAAYTAGTFAPALQPTTSRRGPDHLDNFAWSCPFCNTGKKQRVTFRINQHTLRLFDPRHDRWSDHFTFTNNYLFIVGLTAIGVATQRALGFNTGEISGPLGTRHDSILDGQYPPSSLLHRQ